MKQYSVSVKTAAAAHALTLEEAKLHLRVDGSDEDSLISALIIAAEEWTENHCRRSWVRRTLELRMDCFPGEIRLPRSPVASVVGITYTDQGGQQATVSASSYQADLYSTPPRITPVFGGVWPTPKFGTLNAVVVEYVAGYAPGEGSPTDHAENVPVAVKAAMKLLIGHWFAHRESVVVGTTNQALEMAVKALLSAHEIRDFTLEA